MTPASADATRNSTTKPNSTQTLALELVGKEYDFTSATQINGVLSRLLVFLAQDRISPRRGAVIAFVASLLLRTLPAINLQLHPKPDKNEPVEYVWDIPEPDDNSNAQPTPEAAKSPSVSKPDAPSVPFYATTGEGRSVERVHNKW